MIDRKDVRRVPVILDTDIGTDIDDTWAIALMLKCPELDVKLIVTANGNTEYRTRIVAKLLEAAGRTDIPIGVGIRTSDEIHGQGGWVEGYSLEGYPGTVHADGVDAMIRTIRACDREPALISIGPATNVAAALDRDPGIASRCRYVGMQGSIRKGERDSDEIVTEYNVWIDPQACRKAFEASWSVTVTPLDTCGLIRLTGPRYAKVARCGDPLVQAMLENYRIWNEDRNRCGKYVPFDDAAESSILYDTVAVYLAFAEDQVVIEELGVRVTDEGFTLLDEAAKRIRCATRWRDRESFEAMLADRLAGPREGWNP